MPAVGVGHGRGGIAGDDVALGVQADYAAHMAGAGAAGFGHGAADPAGGDVAALKAARQNADIIIAFDVGVGQAQAADGAARRQDLEQSDVVRGGPVDGQVADDMPVAVESGAVSGQGVPVGIDVRTAHRVVAVGVKVQVGGQFVAVAHSGAAGAAHAGGGAGEGGPVTVPVAGADGAVAVGVPADGVELGQGADLNQVVAVGVVVGDQLELAGAGGVGDGGGGAAEVKADDGVVVGVGECPGVVHAGGAVVVAVGVVQVDVPVGVDAGAAVLGGGFEGGSSLSGGAAGVGGGDAAGRGVPIAVHFRAAALLPADESAELYRVVDGGNGAGGVGGHDGAAVARDQAAGLGIDSVAAV